MLLDVFPERLASWVMQVSTRGPHQQNAFPRHPAYGQHGSALDAIVIAAVQVPAHAKVSNLNGVVLPNQTVPGSQISMDKVEGRQVLHTRRYLGRDIVEGAGAGGKRTHTPMHADTHTYTHAHIHTRTLS